MPVNAVRRTVLLLAAASALTAAPALAPVPAPGGAGPGSAVAQETEPAEPAPPRVQAAYRRWRKRLQRHDVYVGRNLLPEVRAADGSARPPTAAELRTSTRRMQSRWGRWLRATEEGRAVAFKRKVRHKVPTWAKQYLRNVAACESKGNPRAVGGGGAYRGMYQFSVSTWGVVGGNGDPAAASRWEQTWRAWLLLSRHGSGHWPACG
jgi:Transglycosylase-like domain